MSRCVCGNCHMGRALCVPPPRVEDEPWVDPEVRRGMRRERFADMVRDGVLILLFGIVLAGLAVVAR